MDKTLMSAALAALAILAGCIAPTPEDVEAASDALADDAGVKASVVEPVALDGELGVGAYACAAVSCAGRTILPSERIFETEAAGLTDVSLTMAWDATSPGTERLLLGVFTCDPDECGSDAELTRIEYAYGASPLTFELAGIGVPEGERLYVFMNVGSAVSGGVVLVQATTPQPFHIDGTLTHNA